VPPNELNSPEVFTDLRAHMAQLVVLKDRGLLPNVSFGDDEGTRRFVRDVRHLNRRWALGRIAKVPGARRIGKVPPAPIARGRGGRRAYRRRSVRATPRRARSPGSRSDDPDPEPLARQRCQAIGGWSR
jgi:hypothetical protein